MTHKRQSIRDRAITLLTGLTTTGSNVYPSRVYPLKSGTLPGLLIYTVEEESERMSTGGSHLRNLTLAVQAIVKAVNGTIDDDLDTIAEEIEAAISGDRMFNNLAMDSYLMSTEIEFNAEGEQPTGIMTLNFVIVYQTT